MIGDLINDRYEIRAQLGEGGMAVVFQAYDRLEHVDVALKLMKNRLNTGTSEKRFAREFRAISSLHHPNCMSVFEFGETSDFPFFTMELFVGKPINTLHGKPLRILCDALYQACSAVEHMHGQGLIHRDIKPSNLLVRVDTDETTGTQSVCTKLADFGLARFLGSPSSLTGETVFVGTVKYCAPEQFGNTDMDFRADLYSLGVVAYETVSGRFPFDQSRHESAQSLIRAHLTEAPIPLRDSAPNLPIEIGDVVMIHLAKEPAARTTSTVRLMNSLALHAGHADMEVEDSVTANLMKESTRIRAFVGRGDVLATARTYLSRALSPHALSHREWNDQPIPSVLFLGAEAGMGKSRLLQETARMASDRGANIYTGRCFEGNLAPYQPFVEIIRQLLTEVRDSDSSFGQEACARAGDPLSLRSTSATTSTPGNIVAPTIVPRSPSKHTIHALIQDYSSEILRIAPDLRNYLPGEAFRQVDLERETHYVLRAISSMLVELSTLHGTMLCIEDLQWADPSTLNLLRHVVSAQFRGRELSVESNYECPRLAICCTVRSNVGDARTLVQELRRKREASLITLRPLSQDEVHQFVSNLIGCREENVSASILQPLAEKCQGNPFFILESINAWNATGKLVLADGKWTVDASLRDETVWPDSIKQVLNTRLATLTSNARTVVGTAAVLGMVVDFSLLRALCSELTESQLLDATDELVDRGIFREMPTGRSLEFDHDLVRELAYQELSASRRHVLHRRAGMALESGCRDSKDLPIEVLATHFEAAGESEKARRYLIDAGEISLRAYAIDGAIQQLQRASNLVERSSNVKEERRLRDALAMAYGAAGRPAEAITLLRKNVESVNDSYDRARLYGRIGSLSFRVGAFDQAIEFFDRSLAEIEYQRPKTELGCALHGALSYLRQLWPCALSPFRPLKSNRRMRALIARNAYDDLTYLWAQRSVLRTFQCFMHQLLLARQLGGDEVLSHAYSFFGLYMGIFSLNAVGRRAAQRAMTYASMAENAEMEAVARGHLGCACYFGARHDEAETLLRDALKVLDRRGDSWIRMYFYHNLRHLYSIIGDNEKEIASAQVEIQIGEAVHDAEGKCWGSYGVANALARAGEKSAADEYMRQAMEIVAGKDNIIVLPTALQTYGFVDLQAGDYPSARAALEQSRALIEKHWGFVDYSVRCYPLLTEAILGPRWHDKPSALSTNEVRYAWRMRRWAHFWGWRFPNYLPHALRASGRAALVRGQRKKAIHYFQSGIKSAERIGARYDLARLLIDLAKVKEDGANGYEERGHGILTEIGAVLPMGER